MSVEAGKRPIRLGQRPMKRRGGRSVLGSLRRSGEGGRAEQKLLHGTIRELLVPVGAGLARTGG
jgi:hypothetical protein